MLRRVLVLLKLAPALSVLRARSTANSKKSSDLPRAVLEWDDFKLSVQEPATLARSHDIDSRKVRCCIRAIPTLRSSGRGLLLETGFGNPASVEGGHVVRCQEGKMHSQPNRPESESASSENPVAKT
jgi:hypothetical protein